MRLISRKNAYVWCQLFGWGGSLLLNVFFVWVFRSEVSWQAFTRILIWVVGGLLLTHLMRAILIRLKVLEREFDKQVLLFLSMTLVFGFILGLLLHVSVNAFSLAEINDLQSGKPQRLLLNYVVNSVIFILIWNLVYFIFHYVERVRNQQIEALKSETLIRDLQLQTIKSHINPHFIFNSLNSIRALIDENPVRARRAITELSNILRSSMQAEKAETVSFEKELNIVKDYLELEKLRFEERLHFHFEIDPETLNLQVPPMMLQTLVENAIKHGVSKHLAGGEVYVSSKIHQQDHELIIRNSGRLSEYYNAEGFGVSSTKERLHLQFGGKASFELNETASGYVEARICMPIPQAINKRENTFAHA
ncbi:MAG: sensor histidine kinase [Bacteroidota bacterium]